MRFVWRLVDWFGRFQAVQAIANYAWTILPVGSMIGTGTAGALTHEPWMWILFATSGVGAFVTMAMFAGTLLDVWRDPQHKIKFIQANVGLDMSKFAQQGRSRKIDKAQVMIQIRNDSYFPISLILEAADSSISDNKPPRGVFPRNASMLGAGGLTYIMDDPIDMHKHNCENLTGEANFIIKYGKKGNERYTLQIRGNISVMMDNQGVLRGIWFNHF